MLPQSAAIAGDPFTESGLAGVLAGEAADDEVDSRGLGEQLDVAEVGDAGPVSAQDCGAVRVGLCVPVAAGAGCELDSEVEASEPREERSIRQHRTPRL